MHITEQTNAQNINFAHITEYYICRILQMHSETIYISHYIIICNLVNKFSGCLVIHMIHFDVIH